jgi:predicted amidohydrolase YtcJ
MEDRVGLLKPGYAADLVLLDAHLMEVAPEELDRVSVEATLVGGRIVHLAGS